MKSPNPCPFCGSESVILFDESPLLWRAIACTKCFAIGPVVYLKKSAKSTREELENDANEAAVVAWNERATGD